MLAIEYYKKTLTIQQQEKAPLASVYQSLANAHKNLDELDTALYYYETGIKSLTEEKEKERSVDHHEDLCLMHKNLGAIQRRLNLFDKAMDNSSQPVDLYNGFLADGGEHDELGRGILESMAKLHEATGNMKVAEKYRAKKENASA